MIHGHSMIDRHKYAFSALILIYFTSHTQRSLNTKVLNANLPTFLVIFSTVLRLYDSERDWIVRDFDFGARNCG